MSDIYNMIVIGGGAAGLTASAFGGELGAKVALIEKDHLGGDCTWVGCVPSKALLKVAKVAHSIRTADHYGIEACEPEVDMKRVRAHIQEIVQEIYQHETPEVFARRGVEVITGAARFLDAHTIEVNGQQMKAKKFVIATGARAAVPPIPGIDDVPYHTNHTFFDNDRLPEHLMILGAGPIGMEMGQAYRRLGAQVTIISQEIMPRDDHDATAVLETVFEREGVRIIRGSVNRFENDQETIVAYLDDGEAIRGDMLLLAIGRAATVEGFGLEQTGVTFTKRGIEVDQHLQTNIPHIYAIGDCTTQGPKLTHYAGFEGAIAGRNALFPVVNFKGATELVPWVTFTDPEVAQVGLTERAAREQYGDAVKVYKLPMSEGDRALAENDTDGFIKLVYRGSGDLLGATVVAARAGEMITEFTAAMAKGGLRGLISTIHAYPTYSDIVKKASSKLLVNELQSGTTGKLIDTAAKVLF